MPKKLKPLVKDNEETNFDISQIEGPSVPNDLISTKLPDKHKFEVGFHLEMIHPVTSRSLERFVKATSFVKLTVINKFFFAIYIACVFILDRLKSKLKTCRFFPLLINLKQF